MPRSFHHYLSFLIRGTFVFLLLCVLLGAFSPKSVFAQTLSFEPTQQGVAVGQTFPVKININTSGQQTGGADALIVYDPNILSISSVTNGGFYTSFGEYQVSGTTNKWNISGFETDSVNSKSGTGTFATVNFQAKAQGTSTVTFECSGAGKTDSNILKAGTGDDIIACASLGQASFTVGAGGGGNPNNTPGPTVTVLPRSGSVHVTIIAVGIGVVLTIMGVLFKV